MLMNAIFFCFNHLFICILESFKNKIILISWGREMCSNAHRYTLWQNYPDFLSQNSPTPPSKLSVCNVPVYFVFFLVSVCISLVLLYVLIRGSLQHPFVCTNCKETWMFCNTCGGFVAGTIGTIHCCFNILVYYNTDILATYTLHCGLHILTAPTFTPACNITCKKNFVKNFKKTT